MARSRNSAKKAGAQMEILVESFLKEHVSEFITRLRLAGSKDVGDIGNVRSLDGKRIVIEVKNYGGEFKVTPWLNEARVEAGNADAPIAVVIAKRRGTTDPAKQVVFMELGDFAQLLGADIEMETP